jgi:nucleotide-binding universal stress UspA family protein
MATPIVVGYDPGRRDQAPVEFGVAAAKFTGAPLIIAAVHASAAALGLEGQGIVEEQLEDTAGESLDHIAQELRRQGVDAECRALAGTSAPRALHEAAAEFGAGLLVLGSTDRGAVGQVLPGSTAQRLMHGAPCPIAVVPRSWESGGGLRTIGVAYVDTPEGHEALDGAVALARRSGAKLVVLNAAKPRGLSGTFGGGDALTRPTGYEELASTVRSAAERAVAAAIAEENGIDVEPDVSVGDPADFLIAASDRLDLLICGSRGYGPTRAVLLGGVSRRVTNEARCPVIVLARGTEASLEALVGEQSGATGST